MSIDTPIRETASARPADEELLVRYGPVFARIADGAVDRERDRIQPFEQVAWLRESGFTAVTVPQEHGGQGASLEQLFRLLIALAESDSNIPQLLRAHFALIEQLQTSGSADVNVPILQRAAAGTIFGNASHERSAAEVGALATTGTHLDGGGWVLSGTKYYSTGSLFADEIFVPATVGDAVRMFVVPVNARGVELLDDWDGFGQRLTGSGTTVFDSVRLDEGAALELSPERETHLTAFVQLVLLSVLVGISRAARRDAVEFVRTRTRVYSHGTSSTAAEDPLVQQVIGRVSGLSFAAESAVVLAARSLQAAHDSIVVGETDAAARIEEAELTAVQAQLAVIDLVLQVTTAIFEVGGASATSTTRQLDRHWRNARTVSSHNPAIYQARLVGDHLINGAPLQYFWATGQTKEAS